MVLRDVMSTHVVVVPRDTTLPEVAALFSISRISGAPVVGDDRVVGVITVSDLLGLVDEPPRGERSASGPLTTEDWPGSEAPGVEFFTRYWADRSDDVFERLNDPILRRRLSGFTAADAMCRELHCLPADTRLAVAADYMLRHNIHRLLVVEDGRLEGIVTTTDMVRAMAVAPSDRPRPRP